MLSPSRSIIAITVSMAVSSCSLATKSDSFIPFTSHTDKTQIRSIRICTLPKANQDYAIQLDVLFILDKEVLEALPLTSPEWFANRMQFLPTNVGSILPVMLELPPLYTEQLALPKDSKKAVDVVAYANYASFKGQARQTLPNTESVAIYMGPYDWRFSEHCVSD